MQLHRLKRNSCTDFVPISQFRHKISGMIHAFSICGNKQPQIKNALRTFEAARPTGSARNPLNLDTRTNSCFPSRKIRTWFATHTIGPSRHRTLHCLRRASMRRQSRLILLAHGFISRNPGRWQGGKGSRFHPNSLSPAVHGWIRSPCGGSVTILLSNSPQGGSVAGPSSLPDQRPLFSS